jgi:hypothetical protein
MLLTRNKAAALTLRNPRQQSGQGHVCQIYRLSRKLRTNGNQIHIRWVPALEENKLLDLAKQQPRMKSTTLDIAQAHVASGKGLPDTIETHQTSGYSTPKKTHPTAV